jgi:ribosomal protein S18 acetylase RimI-like enzyme
MLVSPDRGWSLREPSPDRNARRARIDLAVEHRMDLEFLPATDIDLPFARALARHTMMPYYTRHGLLWRDIDFDDGWHWRENYLLRVATQPLGFVSLSVDTRALYIRELHLLESARGQGVGTDVLAHASQLASQRRLPLLRLMVFKDNPAQRLYTRMGLQVVGEESCFWRMERALAG